MSQSTVSVVTRKDALSATLFNLVLEYVTRRIDKNNLRAGGSQLIAYADNVPTNGCEREKMTSTKLKTYKTIIRQNNDICTS